MLFAARSRVKMKMVAPVFPDYAREIAEIAKSHAGALRWLAAGQIVALRGESIEMVPVEDAVAVLKTVPEDRYREAACLFG